MSNDQKVLFVLGASSDLGIALIDKVACNYDYILAHYNNTDVKLLELQKKHGEKICLLQADFSDENSVIKLNEKIGETGIQPTHIVHFPSSKFHQEKFHKIDWNLHQEGIDISLRSIVIILKNILPQMAKTKKGKIIFMLSSATLNTPPKYLSYYVSIKYALLGLMKSLAVEYADKGIRVNAVSPDMIETRYLNDIPDLIVQQNAANSPIRRNLSVDDVIPTIEYLLSEQADCVSGQNIGITIGR